MSPGVQGEFGRSAPGEGDIRSRWFAFFRAEAAGCGTGGSQIQPPSGDAGDPGLEAGHSLEFRWMLMSAAFRVLTSSMAIVIGPTPPGTGVIASAFWETAAKSTSPSNR